MGIYLTLPHPLKKHTGVVVEGRKDEAVVFAVDIEDSVDVNFGVVASVTSTLFDGGQTARADVALQQRLQFAQTIGDATNQLILKGKEMARRCSQ